MRQLDREGVFKATPMQWGINNSENSQSVALVVVYRILAQFDAGDWQDWAEYEDHQITGYHYIVKRDGQVNTTTVDNLVQSIGWDGNLDLSAGPPEVVCQITTENEEYNGKSSLKVKWLNPENFAPGPKTADAATVKQLAARYGSPAKPKPAPTETTAVEDEDLPFEGRGADVPGDMPAPRGAVGGGARVAAHSPNFVSEGQDMTAVDQQLAGLVATMEGKPRQVDSLAMLGISAVEFSDMTFLELRNHATMIWNTLDTGERQFLRSAIDQGGREKLALAMTLVAKRKAAAA
jgi:hypothetical protein